MRTIFRIDDDLMDSLREAAVREKTSIGVLVNRLLRKAICGSHIDAGREPFRQKSFAMGRPRFDPEKANEFAGELDDATST